MHKIPFLYNILFKEKLSGLSLDKIEHHKKFKPVLEELVNKQPKEDYSLLDENLKDIIRHTSHNTITERNPISFINLESVKDNSIILKQIKLFLNDTKELSSKLGIKTDGAPLINFNTITSHFNSSTSKETFLLCRTRGYEYTEKISNHPYFEEALIGFSKNLSNASLPVLSHLIMYAEISEFLTCFSVEDKIYFTLGIKVFVHVYGVIKQPNNFLYFMRAVREEVWWGRNSLVKNACTITYKYKYPILITTGSTLTAILFPRVKSFVFAPVDALTLYLPKNPFLKDFYLNVLHSAKSAAFMSSHLFVEVKRILLYKLFGEDLEKGVDFLKDLFNRILNKKK